MNKVRIFIAAPDDVAHERAITKGVIDDLRNEFSGQVVVELVSWDDEPLTAVSNFQQQIPYTGATDIVVTIFWSKLGTPLAADRLRPDGSRYESGTVYEFESAMASAQAKGAPRVLFYRKTTPVVTVLNSPDNPERERKQRELNAYLGKWFGADDLGALGRAFHTFESEAQFREGVGKHLHRQVQKLIDAPPPSQKGAAWMEGSPFQGLKPFEYEHSSVFCGRENAVAQVLSALRNKAAEGRAFVLVVGMSGGGKSSLVRAGVIPAIERAEALAERGLRRAVFRPGDAPGYLIRGLASKLVGEAAVHELAGADFAEDATKSPFLAFNRLEAALRKSEVRLVVLVDQLEELFSLKDIEERERDRFIGFLELLSASRLVWVIATLRSDFCAQAFAHPVIARLKLGEGQVDLQAPAITEIGQMIRLPAQAAGLTFEERDGRSLDDVLQEDAIRNARALPLLQFALEQLHADAKNDRVLKFSTYERFRGMRGSIATRAEEIFNQLNPAAQASLGRVLGGLSTVDLDNGGRIARRRLPLSAFAANDPALDLIKAYEEARLFVLDREGEQPSVEVAHEALLSEWTRAKEWNDRNRQFLEVRNRVTAAATVWDHEGRDKDRLAFEGKPLNEAREVQDKAARNEIQLEPIESEFISQSVARFGRRVRRRRGALVAFATLAVVATGLAFTAYVFQGRAEEQSRKAQQQKNVAQSSISFLTGMFDKMQPRFARGQDVTVRQVMDESDRTMRSELSKPGDKPVLARALRAVGQVYTSTGSTEKAIPILTEALEGQQESGADADELAAAHLALADAYYTAYADEEAATNYQAAFALLNTPERKDSEVLADVLLGMAETEEDEKTSDDYAKESIEVYQRLFGVNDLRVVRARMSVAKVYSDFGDFPKAIPILKKAREDIARLVPADSPDLAEVDEALGFALWQSGSSLDATYQYGMALKVYEKVYDSRDLAIANVLNNLARAELEKCALDVAQSRLRRSLDIQSVSMKLPRPLGALANYNYGLIRWRRGDIREASLHFAQAVDIANRNLEEIRANLSNRNDGKAITDKELLDSAASHDAARAKAAALIGQAELDVDGNPGSAELALKSAKDIYTGIGEAEDSWRWGMLGNARARLLASGGAFDEARRMLDANLVAFSTQWPEGSLFAEIALERIRKLPDEAPSADFIGCPRKPFVSASIP